MARGRTVKPEFFRDRTIGRLGSQTVIVYQAIWCWADDGGVARIEPEVLKGDPLLKWPEFTAAVITTCLVALHGARRIRPYAAGDELLAEVPTLLKHSKINRPSGFRYPREGEEVTDIRAWLSGQVTHGVFSAPSVRVSVSASRPVLPLPIPDSSSQKPFPDAAAVRRSDDVQALVPVEYREQFDRYRRAAGDPLAFEATIRDCGPGGMQAVRGATWLHVGQALREMAASSDPAFSATRLRGFVRRLVPEGPGRTTVGAAPRLRSDLEEPAA